MMRFIEFLIEAKDEKSNAKHKLRDIAKAQLKLKFPDISFDPSKSKRATNELFRANLGKTKDEVAKAINAIFDGTEVQDKYKLGEFKVFGRPVGASSKYNSIELMYDGSTFYVATTDNEKGLLKNKDLTPSKLGLDLSKTYTDTKQLKNAIDLKKIKFDLVQKWLEVLMDEVQRNKVEDVDGCFSAKNAQSFMEENAVGHCTIKFSDKAIEFFNANPMLQADINCIIKDFGEVLGPMILLKLFKGSEITFPTASNEPLVDYKLDNYNVSAKAEAGGGGAPSAKSVFEYAVQNKNDFGSKEQELIEKVGSTFSSGSIFLQQKMLIEEFALAKLSKVKKLLDSMKFSTWKTYNDLAKNVDEYVLKNDIQELFQQIYEETNYTPSNSPTGWPIDKIVKEWNSIDTKIKSGILFYPLYKYAVDQINIQFGTRKVNEADGTEEKDAISHVCQQVLNLKQIYLKMSIGGRNPLDGIKLSAKAGNSSNWKLTVGGISTNNINNAYLSLKMAK